MSTQSHVDQTAPMQRALIALRKLRARVEAYERAAKEPIAVVGVGCRFPGGVTDAASFWELLRSGGDAIREVPPDRWDAGAYYDPDPDTPGKMTTRWGGFLDGVDQFDPRFFGISPREAAGMDPQHRLLLEVLWWALEDAALPPDKLAGTGTGVFVGISGRDYLQRMMGAGTPGIDAYFATGNAGSTAAGRLSYVLGLQGPCIAVDTACSSSLVSTHLACQALRNRECDLALAGGVNLILSPEVTITLSKARMMSSEGRCKAFAAAADGFVRSEGCGMVVLKRLSDAESAGDRVLAVIRGSACNQDGRSSGLTAPNGQAQQAVIRSALAAAGVEASKVSYVEAHGTGTELGDPIELGALGAVLGRERPRDQLFHLGSVKTNVGHLEAAAGIAGLIKVVLMLRHRQIPAHLHFHQPNPHIPWSEVPVTVATETTPWSPPGGVSLVAGVSSFGFGGTNAHVVLEEAPAPAASEPTERPLHVLALSAGGEKPLHELARKYHRHLEEDGGPPVADVCFTSNAGRAHLEHRLLAIGADAGELRDKLAAFTAGDEAPGLFAGRVTDRRQPEVVFLFSGQGSQQPGMGRRLYETQPVFRRALERCDEVLRSELEQPLLSVLYPEDGDGTLLHQTAYAQPALFALEYALAELWRSWGVEPAAVLGHSVGEYAAAQQAGVFSLEEGLKLIAERGRRMQELPAGGAMASVMAPEERVREAIAPYPDSLAVAALNGPRSTVISGRSEVLEDVLAELQAEGVKTRRLEVSHAFHSPLMEPVLAPFEQAAQAIRYQEPRLELISNVRGEAWAVGELPDAAYWRRHVRAPVRFGAGMESLRRNGYRIFVEIGPGATLLGMGRRSLEQEGDAAWLPSLRPGRDDWQQILETLAQLHLRGVGIDWNGFDRDARRCRVTLPSYPFERQRYWCDCGTGEPASPAAAPGGAERKLESCLYELRWQGEERPEPAAGEPGTWLILDGGGLGGRLAELLAGRGHVSLLLDPEDGPGEVTRLLGELRKGGGAPCRGVVDLRALEDAEAAPEGAAANCRNVLALIQALAGDEPSRPPRLWLVTRGAQTVLAGASPQLATAPLWGLGRTIRQELPDLWGGLVDLDPEAPESEAGDLLAEILGSLPDDPRREDEVAWRAGRRYAARLASFTGRPVERPPIRAEGCYLVTGGLGGLGLRVARWLADEGARHLLLVGRKEPSPEARKLLEPLEEAGVKVEVACADVADREALAGVLAGVRETTVLRGVVHAAGVLDDGVLPEQSWERFATVLAPKAGGAWNLHELTRELPLDFFVLFSSTASLLGSPGQSGYAAANAFLDGLSHFRRARGLPALTVNWGPWAEVGMAAELEAAGKGRRYPGVTAIPPEQGVAALARLLRHDACQSAVLDVDWPAFLSHDLGDREPPPVLRDQAREVADTAPPAGPERGREEVLAGFLACPPEEREAFLRDYLRRSVARVLGLDPTAVSDRSDVLDLGADSLMVMELVQKWKGDLNLPLYPREVYDYPVVADLAVYLRGELEGTSPPARPAAGDDAASDDAAPDDAVPAAPVVVSRRNPSMVFLLSSPRSGSTLLRVMLAGHPDLFCPPELHLLPFDSMAERERKLRGSYLGEGLQRAFMELQGEDGAGSQQWIEGLLARDEGVPDVYRRLQELAGDRLLVDKSPSYGDSLGTLRRAEAIFEQPRYVLLVRHPLATVDSIVKNRMHKVVGVRCEDPLAFAEEVWTRINRNLTDFAAEVGERCHQVRFEDLVSDPEPVLRELCSFLGLPWDPAVLTPYEGRRMTDGVHRSSLSIGDPNFLKRSKVEPSLGEAWKSVRLPRDLGAETRRTAGVLGYSWNGSSRPEAVPAKTPSVLVPLQEGSGRPLFCFHPAGGEVLVYRPLARLLGGGRPLYGVQSRALDNGYQELGSLEEMATAYAAALRQRQPEGPYQLLGWSMGGRLAVAVAGELESQGQQVDFVGMLDSRYPTVVADPFDGEGNGLASLALAFGGRLAHEISTLRPAERTAFREELLALEPRERLSRVVSWGKQRGVLPEGLPAEQLERQAGLVTKHVGLLERHTPRPVGAPIHLWWAREDLHRRPPTDWTPFTTATVHEKVIGGDHFSMVRGRNLAALARELAPCLERRSS